MISEHDRSIIHRRLIESPKNVIYIAHSIQNELLHLLAKNVMLKEVKESAYCSIIVYESRNISPFCGSYLLV